MTRHTHAFASRRRQRIAGGFTLIELLAVLAITGILAAAAGTSYRSYLMRSKRAEAIVGLDSIHQAQVLYLTEFGIYADTFDEIGFSVEGGQRVDERTVRAHTYTFTMQSVELDGNPRGNFQALATGDLDPGDGVLDILMIENQLTISQ